MTAAGSFRVAPVAEVRDTRRTYLPATNVLATTFTTTEGVLELTDCMPVRPFDPDQPAKVDHHASVLRRLRCTSGRVTVAVDLQPRFEYGIVLPRFTPTSPTTAAIVGGADALWVRASRELGGDREHVTARWEVDAGEEVWLEVEWTPAADRCPHDTVADHTAAMGTRFVETVAFWETWLARCAYVGDHERRVHRAALVLKALTYAPTGAVVAAGTTSLPEWIGGVRNWDYRFTWIRDATLTLASLVLLGYLAEADSLQGLVGADRGRTTRRSADHVPRHRRAAPARSSSSIISPATAGPRQCGSETVRPGSCSSTRSVS